MRREVFGGGATMQSLKRRSLRSERQKADSEQGAPCPPATDSAGGQGFGEAGCPLPSYGVRRVTPGTFFENIGENLFNFVQFDGIMSLKVGRKRRNSPSLRPCGIWVPRLWLAVWEGAL